MFAYMVLEPVAKFKVEDMDFEIYEAHVPGISKYDFNLQAYLDDYGINVGQTFPTKAVARAWAKKNVGDLRAKILQGVKDGKYKDED